jgi:diguanylate cyclase (GGDEF)-like protein/PAS domain S-box-containing protein
MRPSAALTPELANTMPDTPAMSPGEKLASKQIREATGVSGKLDMKALKTMIAAAYDEADRDRKRTDRSIALMVDELETLNAGLEKTVRERTTELLHASSRLTATFNAVKQGIVMIGREGDIQITNEKAREFLGLGGGSAAEGNEVSALLTALVRRANQLDKEMASGLPGGAAHPMLDATDCLAPDGRILSVQMALIPSGGSVVTLLDVTAEREQEAALVEAEARYRALFDNAVIGVYRTTPSGEQLFANPALVKLNGFESEREMLDAALNIGSHWYVDPERRAQFIETLERDGRVHDFVSEVYRLKTRERMWVSETAWIVRDASGTPLCYEGTVIDATERIEAQRRITYIALHDELTGLSNRSGFRDHLQRAWTRKGASGTIGLLCVDLDRFKEVNDTMGHQAGDQLLFAVAARLIGMTDSTHHVARLGGDEFAIVVTECKGMAELLPLANRIIAKLSEPLVIDSQPIVIGATIGIALRDAETASADQLLRNADIALYRAKAEGRGRAGAFEDTMAAQVKARRDTEMDLRYAIQREELDLHFQPIVDATTESIVSCEALIRWNHPQRGAVGPQDFIPIAEECGLMIPLGEWVLRRACAVAATWPAHVGIAVNLSPVQFRSRGLLPAVIQALSSTGLSPSRLELEITESVLMMDDRATEVTLRGLKRLGVKIALDDFGTGHSSLSYLHRFSFDKIKIDQGFIRSMNTDAVNAAIVRAVISLGVELGISVVAEGVETRDQAEALKAEGCPLFQGYLFSRPVAAAKLPFALREEAPSPRAEVTQLARSPTDTTLGSAASPLMRQA